MEKRIALSEQKAQELQALLEGQSEAQSGSEWLSALVRLSTERVLQEALEQEQAQPLGRTRYERRVPEALRGSPWRPDRHPPGRGATPGLGAAWGHAHSNRTESPVPFPCPLLGSREGLRGT